MRDFNRQYFSDKDVKEGLHIKFIQFLLDNFESKEYRVDMHVYHEDCGAIVVEWIRPLWKYVDDLGSFKFVDCDEDVMKEVQFPDGHYDYAHSNLEADEMLERWKREHSGDNL